MPCSRNSLALVRVSGPAILAQMLVAMTLAVEALVQHHTLAGPEIGDFGADFLDHARDLVAEDLRRDFERNRRTALIAMIVGRPGVDVEVGAAQPDGLRPHQDIPHSRRWAGYVLHLHVLRTREHDGLHALKCTRIESSPTLPA